MIKVRSSSTGNIPIILKVNEAPYNPSSPITLLSEYQIREYGLIIDSVAKKHYSAPDTKGKQLFQVNKWVHINYEDRGGLMGFELLPFEKDDEETYEVITITSLDKWIPHRFQNSYDMIESYDPNDLKSEQETYDYPARLNHVSILKSNQDNLVENFEVELSDPLIDTQICATTTWHRVIYKEINPLLVRPYLGYRQLAVIKKTLDKTTQLARMIIRHPMRCHVKSRFPHMNVSRIDEPISTDPMFTNCWSIYHGFMAAQIFYGTKSQTIFVHGIKKKVEFPKEYRDFFREHGALFALRRDNAKEEQSEIVKEINREFLIKDQLTEPYRTISYTAKSS